MKLFSNVFRVASCAIFVATCGGGGPAAAQQLTLMGSNFDLSTGMTTQRRSPSVAYNSTDNEFMVAWFDTRNSGNNDIFGQRVSSAGALLGTNFPIIEFAEAQLEPIVVHNSVDNEYLVGWRTQQPDSFNDVWGRRISNGGALVGDDFFILGDDPTAAGGGGGNEFSIAYNSTANEYLVTGRGRGVRGRRVSNSGALLGGSEIVITPPGGADAPNGQVVYNRNVDEFLATWRDGVAQDLKGQRISGSGLLLGGAIIMSTSFPESGRPTASVAFDPTNDQYLVVFGVFQENRILGQFVSSSGELIGENFPIATDLASRAVPYVAYNENPRAFVVVWREDNDIIGQLLMENGSVIGCRLIIAKDTAAGNPTLAASSATVEFLVTWPDNRNVFQGEQDIFGQLIGIVSAETVIEVDIDIKPFGKPNEPNKIKLRGKRFIKVAILSTNIADGDSVDFDALQVDPTSVAFGPNCAPVRNRPSRVKVRDKDRDGDPDLYLRIKTRLTGISCGDTEAILTGETYAGDPFIGSDSIMPFPCR